MNRNWTVAGFSVTGIVLGMIEAYQFLEVRFGMSKMGSMCQSGAFDCVRVESSPYAAIFGMPTALFGVGWFLATLVFALLGMNATWRNEAHKMLRAMSWLGVLVGASLLGIMIFEIRALCLFCLGTDACLVGVLLTARGLPTGDSVDPVRWKKIAIMLVGCIAVALGLGTLVLPQAPSHADFERIAAELDARRGFVVPERDRPSIGPKDAPVTIVKFSDFQCPACQRGAVALHRALPDFEGKVRFVFRNFPLDASCNRLIKNKMHEHACEVAKVALCAWKFGKFKEFYEEIFNRQKEIAAGFAAEVATGLGVGKADLDRCVEDPAVMAMIREDIDDGEKLEIMSTPTFFINGKRFEGGASPDIWRLLIAKYSR